MIAAIIDCGTNTFNLLIADIRPGGEYYILLNTKKSVKLAEGGLADNKIAKKPFDRGINTFIEFVDIARKYKADTIQAFATAAIRSTLNGPDFVKKIHDKTGVIIQVLNGDTEAQYIFKGVNLALNNINHPVLVMDIGGGSTEFIIAENNQVIWKKSFDLGAARLLEVFQPSDPITPEQIELVKEHFRELLQPLKAQLKNVRVNSLIGCSGSFESLAEMIRADKNESNPIEKLYTFNNDELKTLHRKLLASTEDERRQMNGLVHYRVDTIVFASIFIRYIRKRFKIDQLSYSSYALKEGVLADLLYNQISE